MNDHTIDGLRAHLFDLIGNLANPAAKVDLDRGRLMIDAARTIVETAKAETDRIRVVGRPADTGFIPVVAAPVSVPKIGGAK